MRKGQHCTAETRKKISLANKGRKRSPETRIKMSRSHKGKKLSLKHRANMSIAQKGRKHSPETRAKISASNTGAKNHNFGQPLDAETRAKLSAALKGEKNPNFGKKTSPEVRAKLSAARKGKYCGEKSSQWKGGISSEPYCIIWDTVEGREYKKTIMERDNHECQNPECWKKCNKICLHHINYDKKDCRPEKLITVCWSCNSRANTNREYWKKLYQDVMKKKLNKAEEK